MTSPGSVAALSSHCSSSCDRLCGIAIAGSPWSTLTQLRHNSELHPSLTQNAWNACITQAPSSPSMSLFRPTTLGGCTKEMWEHSAMLCEHQPLVPIVTMCLTSGVRFGQDVPAPFSVSACASSRGSPTFLESETGRTPEHQACFPTSLWPPLIKTKSLSVHAKPCTYCWAVRYV